MAEPHRDDGPGSVELLARWYDGDEDALATLVERHRPWLWRFARSRMSERLRAFDSSEDVVQEALLHLLRYGPAFLPRDEGQFRALIARMVTNRILDLAGYARAERRAPEREERQDSRAISRVGPAERSDVSPDRVAAAREEEELVHLAVALIDPGDRELIVLHRFEGRTFREIGARLGVEPKAANKRFSRAVVRLGDMLGRLKSGELDDLVSDVGPFVGSGGRP